MMTPHLQKIVRAGVKFAAVSLRSWHAIKGLFLSPAKRLRRATGRFETLKRRELEAERLDRLRNPGNYQGR